jgi:putative hydrolase
MELLMKIEADLHIHTVASGHAYSTVAENIQGALEKGLKLIAITDHGPGLPGGAHAFHFWNLRILPREAEGVKILRGIEANIIDAEGHIDLADELLETLDIVHLALHTHCGYEDRGAQKNTDTVIKAMQNPHVDVLVHPGNRKFPIDAARIVQAAKDNDVLLEVNNSSFLTSTSRAGSYELDLAIIKEAKVQDVNVVVGSDAHYKDAVGNFGAALELLDSTDFPLDHVLNISAEKVIRLLERKKKRQIF